MRCKDLALGTLLALGAAAGPVAAIEQGDWVVRGRVLAVAPQDNSAALFVGGAPLAGSGASVDTGDILDIDISDMFTDDLGAELLRDRTSEHDIDAEGTLAAVSPGTIISARLLPPSLLLQYHFMAKQRFKPYVGAGINCSTFLDVDETASARATLGLSNVDPGSSFGLALPVGAVYRISDRWYLNADSRSIDLSTTATAGSTLGPIRVDVDVDPLLSGMGVGYRF